MEDGERMEGLREEGPSLSLAATLENYPGLRPGPE